MKKKTLIILLVTSMFIINAFNSSAQASTLVFVENFENDLSNWMTIRNQTYTNPSEPCANAGQPAVWKIENGQGVIEIKGSSCTTELIPKSLNLENKSYLYEFDWHFTHSTEMDRNVLVAWQDTKNWYGLKTYGSLLILQKVKNGHSVTLPNYMVSYPFQVDQQYHFSILVTQRGQISVSINQEPVMNVQDSVGEINGFRTIGLQASVGSNPYSISQFDNVKVTQLDPFLHELPVLHLMQSDPAWSHKEYDSASSWSSHTSIHHWGCALTSMAMILHYYDISELPNGEEINPDSLNRWLLQQPDGYVGHGNLNWLAVTRLTHLINAKRGTPKLEYQRFAHLPLVKAQEELAKEHPVILHLEGHFIVGSGLSESSSDLVIRDPLFEYSFLSQHQKPLLSTRVFSPSFTDLSYLLVVTDPEVSVSITDQYGSAIPNVETYVENIADLYDSREISSPPTSITQLAKPPQGRYIISLTSNDTNPHTVFMYAYDSEGYPTQSQQEISGIDSIQVGLHFDPGSTSTFDTNSPFIQLQQTLSNLQESQGFLTPMLYPMMDYLARVGEKAPNSYHSLIVDTLQLQVQSYPTLFSQLATDVLLTELERIKQQFSPAP